MKTTKRENKSGTVRYLHLAHNEWDPAKGRAVPRVLFTFGREDDLDREAIRRLVASLSRLLEPGEALAASAAPGLEFASSVPSGGAYVLGQLWRRMRIDQVISRVGQPRRGRRAQRGRPQLPQLHRVTSAPGGDGPASRASPREGAGARDLAAGCAAGSRAVRARGAAG